MYMYIYIYISICIYISVYVYVCILPSYYTTYCYNIPVDNLGYFSFVL